MKRDWLRGCKLRQFKKWYGRVNNDGVYYRPKEYEQLIKEARKLRVGDLIYNIYIDKMEKIKEIHAQWEPSYGYYGNFRILYIEFITESGYIIYDINDKDYAFYSMCSIHQTPDPECDICKTDVRDALPDYDKKHAEAVKAGLYICKNCKFEYYKTTDTCPLCSTRRDNDG